MSGKKPDKKEKNKKGALPPAKNFSEKIEAFMSKNGFIWGPEPEIYNGMAGFYTYGPLGKLLKNNIEEGLRFVFKSNGFFEVETPIILPEEVWRASGHLEAFVDPVVTCKKCKSSFRADKLLEENKIKVTDTNETALASLIKKHGLKCPKCKSALPAKIDKYNLMMKTISGGRVAFNRPETATATYLPFIRYFDFFRKKLPILIFQMGKAFRNEISPRQNVIRGREFTQSEAQLFISPDQEANWEPFNAIKFMRSNFYTEHHQKKGLKQEEMTFEELIEKKVTKKPAFAWCMYLALELFLFLGIPPEKLRFRQHCENERAHYADDAWDVEVKTNAYGWIECCGVHDRTDYDLKRHSKFSNKQLVADNDEYPHVLEIAFGTDRLVYAVLDLFYTEDVKNNRILLRIPFEIAPIKVAVFPLVNKDGLPEIARKIYAQLIAKDWEVIYDASGSIGRRYRRIDERGVPVALTVDYDTKKDHTVTLRDRDSMDQVRVPISKLEEKLTEFIYSGTPLKKSLESL